MGWLVLIVGAYMTIGPYETKEQCEEVAKIVYEKTWNTAYCIPAPNK